MTNSSFWNLILGNDALMVIAVGVLVLTGVVIALSIAMMAHHLVTDRQRKMNRERFESAAIILSPHLVANDEKLEEAVEIARRKNGDRAVALVLRRSRYDLKGPVTERISEILNEMGEVGKLMSETRSRRDWKRAIAVRGLGECGGAEARVALIEASRDESGEVRRASREGLLSDGSQAAIKAAIQSFITDLPRRAGWRRSFYARLAVVASEELTELIRSRQLVGAEEKLALEALGDAGRQSALALAIERLPSNEGEMRATAVRVLGKVGGEREVAIVLEALRDSEWFVRAAAARSVELMLTANQAIRHSGLRQTACDRLGERLTDTSWWVRANAARALARSGESGVGVLLRATEQTDRYARDAAIAALAMAPLAKEARLTIKKRIETIVDATAPVPTAPTTRPGGLFA